MIGVSFKRVVLSEFDPTSLYPYVSIEIIDDASGELQELADIFAGVLISAICNGELKQIDDSDEISKVIFFRTQHNETYWGLGPEEHSEESINPKPYRFNFDFARFRESDIIAVCEKYSLYNDFFYPEQKNNPFDVFNKDGDYYAPELAALVDAWRYVADQASKNLLGDKTPRQALLNQLPDSWIKYKRDNDNEILTTSARDAMATIANYDKKRGPK